MLEYFMFHELKNEFFYESMRDFGITNAQADNAIETLVNSPYNLLDPDFIYSIDNHRQVDERYVINNKGKMYLKEVVCHQYYFDRMKQHFDIKNFDSKKATPSNRSFYDVNKRLA